MNAATELFIFAPDELRRQALAELLHTSGAYTICETAPENTPYLSLTVRGEAAALELAAHGSTAPASLDLALPVKAVQLLEGLEQLAKTLSSAPIALGNDLWFDPGARLVRSASAQHSLTEKESELLHYLYARSGQVIAREQLLEEVWRYDPSADTHTLETHIYRLRHKLQGCFAPGKGVTTQGQGYALLI